MSLQTFFDDFALFTAAPGGVARLRKLVLRLAVEGRVVSQDPKEESAEKAIRRAKKTDALLHPAPNEAPFVLPNGWAWLNLADLGTWAIGSGFPTNEQGEKDKRILFCKVSDMNLDGNEKRIIKTQNTIDDEAARRIRAKAHPEGTVVFPKIGGAIATNKRRILTRSTAIDNNCLGIVPSEYCSSDWLYLLLSSIDLMQYQSGTSVPALSQSVIGEILTALPPLEEQKRIVAKVDELMRLCDELELRQRARRESCLRLNNVTLAPLSNAASLTPDEFDQTSVRLADNFATLYDSVEAVSRLRSTILKLAVQGKLVPQDSRDEPASALFEKIKSEKTRLIKEKAIRKSQPLPPIEQEETRFKLPENWRWVRLGDIGDWGAGATPNRSNSNYYGGAIRWFKSGELNDGYIRESEEHITELALKDCSLRQNQPGDVLIAMYGATIGKLAILETTATTNQAVCACTCFNGLSNRYLFLLLKAYKSHFTGRGAGGAQPNISREKIIHTVAPLPPGKEQKRIVVKVDQLMALCDELETKLSQAEADSEKLMNVAVRLILDTITSKQESQREIALAL